eukprot:670150-Prymnesium_polylepis.1
MRSSFKALSAKRHVKPCTTASPNRHTLLCVQDGVAASQTDRAVTRRQQRHTSVSRGTDD